MCSEIDCPVRLNLADHEIWIRSGDIIVGDADGVVCLPKSLAQTVLGLLPELVSGLHPREMFLCLADEKALEDVKKGVSVKDAFQKHRGKV
jgi:hypothetical protein